MGTPGDAYDVTVNVRTDDLAALDRELIENRCRADGNRASGAESNAAGPRHIGMTPERTCARAYSVRAAMVYGIDVSGWQENIRWTDVPKSEVQFVFAKATEGLRYYNDRFHEQHDGAKRSGIPFGTYHYLDVRDSGAAQAKHFLTAISGYEGTLLPALDVEEAHGRSPQRIAACVADFLKTVDATLQGKRALLYTNKAFWNDAMAGCDDFSDHPLWIAQYPKRYRSGMQPALPQGWKSAVIWQFTQSASVPGIAGVADMDQLIGDVLSTISR